MPRSAQAEWQDDPVRRDPVAIVLAAEAGRIDALLPMRHARMAPDPFAFLRGAAAVMAADLRALPHSGLTVVACGDAHLGNFGATAGPDSRASFDVLDFDEAAPAPFEWDLKRLAASLVVAGHAQGKEPVPARKLAKRAAHAYRCHIDHLARLSPLDAWRDRVNPDRAIAAIGERETRRRERNAIAHAVEAARTRYAHLIAADGRLHLPERPPAIWRLDAHEATAHLAYGAYVAGLPPERRVLLDRYRLRDVAFKAVGVGSVGTFCALGLFASGDGHTLLLQLKQAMASVLTPTPNEPGGARVVSAQRVMQASPDPFLAPTRSAGQEFYVRALADPRLAAIGRRLEANSLPFYAALCGRTLARAHARSGDAATIAGYMGEGTIFDDAIASFAERYAEQTVQDHAAWCRAIADHRVTVP